MSRQSTCGECGGTYSHMVDCPTYRRMTNTHEARQRGTAAHAYIDNLEAVLEAARAYYHDYENMWKREALRVALNLVAEFPRVDGDG